MKAHVDISTGKIFGCEKGSLEWWHEKGHLEFNSNPECSWLLMLKSYLFDFWMMFVMAAIVYNPLLPLAVCVWGSYFFIGIYEEWWCNKYAKKHYKILETLKNK